MTSKEKKAFLQQYIPLNAKINRLLDERMKWQSIAERTTSMITGMPRGGGGDRLATCIDKIIHLEKQLDEETDKLIGLRNKINLAIASIGDTTLELVLQYRYIDGYSWVKIAQELNYCREWVCKLHGQALKRLKIEKEATLVHTFSDNMVS